MKKSLKLFAAIAIIAGFCQIQTVNGAEIAEKEVKELYKKHCTSCHGDDGKGNTRMGRKAGVKDYTDKEFVASIKDDEALKKILEGLKDDKGAWAMKPFKAKLSEEETKALIAYMKDFAKD